jgi:hypothetical protein
MGIISCSIGVKLIFKDELDILIRALTAVRRAISFLSL